MILHAGIYANRIYSKRYLLEVDTWLLIRVGAAKGFINRLDPSNYRFTGLRAKLTLIMRLNVVPCATMMCYVPVNELSLFGVA
jgi:hypothetical protein